LLLVGSHCISPTPRSSAIMKTIFGFAADALDIAMQQIIVLRHARRVALVAASLRQLMYEAVYS